MPKEVGASGQISLGKKQVGPLFDMQTAADGSIVMRPVRVVPVIPTVQGESARYASKAISEKTGTAEWAQQNAEQHEEQMAQYNAWAAGRRPVQRLGGGGASLLAARAAPALWHRQSPHTGD